MFKAEAAMQIFRQQLGVGHCWNRRETTTDHDVQSEYFLKNELLAQFNCAKFFAVRFTHQETRILYAVSENACDGFSHRDS